MELQYKSRSYKIILPKKDLDIVRIIFHKSQIYVPKSLRIPSTFHIKYNTTPGRVSSPNRAVAVAITSSGE